MIERSANLQRRKISESHAKLQKDLARPKLSLNARHKAFWVDNQSEATLPSIHSKASLNRSINVSPRSRNRNLSRVIGAASRELLEKRRYESLDPLPISGRGEKITAPEAKGDMKLVQQYVMVNGRLQPALKYIAPIPMFNRYKVKNAKKEQFHEIMTYPTVSGDLAMKNKHVGVNFDDRDIPQKALPNE